MTDFHALLREKFGLQTFRPGQLEAIQALLEHNRLLCIQPTGYGKSLLYQLPSCVLGGLTLVISPLLALMRDQIDQLTHRFHISAATLNSDQTEEENALTRAKILNGDIQILFVSPEQLDHIDRFEFLLREHETTKLPINLLVIDEAHCISTWGHDFRPSYRHILQFTQALKKQRPDLKILALTATADKNTEKDIVLQLSANNEPVHVWRDKMDRPNIHLSVLLVQGMAAKLALCQALLHKLQGHGLIYCATRENVELVTEYLAKQGLSIIGYHAGLESEEKRAIQTAFSQNTYRVIAATTALGMGIDKKDLRFVIHFDIPGSITAYYQEVGRAGRDGQKAEGILLYDKIDRKVQDYFIDSALPTAEDFQLVVDAVRTAVDPPNLTYIKRISGLHPTRVTIVCAELLDQQFVRKESLKGVQVYRMADVEPTEALNLSRYTVQHRVKTEELNKIISYAEQMDHCRMALLRGSLGDVMPDACGRCDVCLPVTRKTDIDAKEA
ncbi:MAG TPA: ATP-dependent DNA helicase RecQ, partial [Chlamydiales bacterium]|nr:ATP-dependent DNA helicase RecQ [Chlamydiales bacterium]